MKIQRTLLGLLAGSLSTMCLVNAQTLDQALPVLPAALEDAEGGGGGVVVHSSGVSTDQNPIPPIVVQTRGDATSSARLEEDLAVLNRILSRNLQRKGGRDQNEFVLGIMLSTVQNHRRPGALYLEGHGAVFQLQVGFPLRSPATAATQPTAGKSEDEWERTRRELQTGESPATPGFDVFSDILPFAGRPTVKFDPARVEALQRDLIESLRNVANIRDLKPEESVTVIVSGPAASGSIRRSDALRKRKEPLDSVVEAESVEVVADTPADKAGKKLRPMETVLVLSVRKTDAQTFSKGGMTVEEFTRKVRIQTR